MSEQKSTSILDVQVDKTTLEDFMEPGGMNIASELRLQLSKAIKKWGGMREDRRYELAAEMSKYLGEDVRKTTLDAMTAPSKQHNRFPLEWLPAFCIATGNPDVARFVVESFGCALLNWNEKNMVRLHQLEQARRKIDEEIELMHEAIARKEDRGERHHEGEAEPHRVER